MRVAFYKYHRPGLKGIFDTIIRFVSGGPYSHCELIFSDGLAFSASIQDGGCRFKRIAFDSEKWDILEIKTSEKEEKDISWFCQKENGRGYDFAGVFRFVIPLFHEAKKRWFCSEICCAAILEAGIINGVRPWEVSPSRLHQILSSGRGNK